jgi:hypothetical protein
MRIILRLLGTWLLALALILVIIDGTRSLGANRLIFTSFGETWSWINAQSIGAVRDFLGTRLFGPLLEVVVDFILSSPGWAVLAIPGVILAWLGRSRRSRLFVRQDQI